MFETDRMLAVIKPTNEFVSWFNTNYGDDDDPLTLEDMQEDCTALLLPLFEQQQLADEYLHAQYEQLLASELMSWEIPPEECLQMEVDLELFREWFDIEYHSLVLDLVPEAEQVH